MKTIIKVEDLSKRYRIGLKEKVADTFAQQMWNSFKAPINNFKRIKSLGKFEVENESVHWALKDVSFEVKQGEVLGIIGKNGAGKSTLLKILSKITEPTSGRIEMNGRIAALLEVGTGFHPELTGRENIYMNGTILGMTKKEINQKLDEIIDFSGVEKYIDTPVKFYSSGMRVRLGFSVAAHLEPEVLIIDEVLAVGDYEFQQKCLGKMEDVSKNEGRTVLFVSHNMQAVSSLTKKSILLENGYIKKNAPTLNVIEYYLAWAKNSEFQYTDNSHKEIYIKSIKLNTSIERNIHFFKDDFEIEFIVYSDFPLKNAAISYQIINSSNIPVLHILNLSSEVSFLTERGCYKLISRLPSLCLYPDKYKLNVYFADSFLKVKYQTLEDVCPFEVQLKNEIREYYWYKGHATFIHENMWISSKIS